MRVRFGPTSTLHSSVTFFPSTAFILWGTTTWLPQMPVKGTHKHRISNTQLLENIYIYSELKKKTFYNNFVECLCDLFELLMVELSHSQNSSAKIKAQFILSYCEIVVLNCWSVLDVLY